jgi:tetratricopeptide (TPR) repeat protein
VLVGWAGYTFWRERGNQQAAGLMSEAMTIMQARVVSPAAPAPSKPAAPATPPEAGTYPTETAKREAALPKFLAAADAYPNTALGLAARYHAASLLTALGRLPEAEQRYGEVIDRAGTGIYAEMARMGRAEVQAMAGKHKEAIAAWEELSKKTTSEVPQDAVLLQLARTYKLAGRPDDAMKTYQRVIDEFPTSPFGADARQELDALKTAPQVAQR